MVQNCITYYKQTYTLFLISQYIYPDGDDVVQVTAKGTNRVPSQYLKHHLVTNGWMEYSSLEDNRANTQIQITTS